MSVLAIVDQHGLFVINAALLLGGGVWARVFLPQALVSACTGHATTARHYAFCIGNPWPKCRPHTPTLTLLAAEVSALEGGGPDEIWYHTLRLTQESASHTLALTGL